MSDFESRLRDTLDERAASAPDSTGLARGARRRMRRRRTTRAVAAAAVVAAAVPLGLSQWGGVGRDPAPADEPTVATSPDLVESGYRTESWHDVTFEVPVEWGYGGVTAWCAGGTTLAEARPVVTRPDTMVATIMCSPGTGWGVTINAAAAFDPAYQSGHVWQFQGEGVADAQYPDGAWLGYWYGKGTSVTVVSPDRVTTQRIVGSVESRYGVDDNGCPALLANAEATRTGATDSLSLCRYDEEEWLTASRRLTGEEARAAEETILHSPAQRIDYDCPTPGPLSRTAVLLETGYVATVVVDGSCEGHNGVFLSGAVHVVDDAVRELVDLTRLP